MSAENKSIEASPVRSATYLILFALASAITLASVDRFTRERVVENELAERLNALNSVLQVGEYDNQPHLDTVTVVHPELLGSDDPLPVYRVRLGEAPVAAVMTTVAPNGFSGEIRLFVAVNTDGEVLAVRVIAHSETPGLGDLIEHRKSDWIDEFAGLQTSELLANPISPIWTLDRDGGDFDHISGATVTSRAVLKAVRDAVLYFDSHRAEIFAPPLEGGELH